MSKEVAVLGVGMHPWGKWGKNFVEYGVKAAQDALADVELSPKGKLWSFTGAEYQPPAPYVPRHDPFQPFSIAAVELEAEKITILGQVIEGVKVADLKIGEEMELVLDTLLEDAETETIVWKWKPVRSAA